MTRALVVGEAVLDVVHAAGGEKGVEAGSGPGSEPSARPGGSAVNTAVALARLGRGVDLATAYAADAAGTVLDEHLAAARVHLAGEPHVLASTPRAVAHIDASGAASYDFEVAWALPAGVLAEPAPHVLHVTSLAPLLAPGADDVAELVAQLRGRTTVSYDVNLRPAITGTGVAVVEAVRRTAGLADLVKASDEDLAALWPGDDVGASAARLLELGPAAVVVTHGDAGASWHSRCGEDWCTGGVPGVPVRVVDTIGAGDTFSAALLDHLWPLLGAGGADRVARLDADGWAEALRYAVRVAAVTVSRPGADPPTRAEVDAAYPPD
ncbi:carbohydrate kinase [Nocardioides sp. zg-ZUI104]|uniref:PfkB family carbohydrate kinase n=1 Tax=Nocardioides faecalis TaxID=2803858 RepID=UPI001BCD3471|nr:PfkB family carbohydrate kinase [Nocardioides faecalis]MBS4753458.1 carbohydrate kinase [Nocardioides faecalis]